jgi:hypothetical protein
VSFDPQRISVSSPHDTNGLWRCFRSRPCRAVSEYLSPFLARETPKFFCIYPPMCTIVLDGGTKSLSPM